MKQKKIITLVTAMALAAAIAGCSTVPNTSSDSSAGPEESGQTEVSVTSDGSSGKKPSHDSARSPEEGHESTNKVTGQVKAVSGTSVTLAKGTLKKVSGSDAADSSDSSSSSQKYEFTADDSGEEATYDLSSVKDVNMDDIKEGKILVITLGDDGKPAKIKIRTNGETVTGSSSRSGSESGSGAESGKKPSSGNSSTDSEHRKKPSSSSSSRKKKTSSGSDSSSSAKETTAAEDTEDD